MVHTLRHVVGLPIERVREVVDAVRTADPVTLMGTVQSAVLGLPAASERPEPDPDPAVSGGDPDRLTAAEVVEAMGWAPGAADATAALDRDLRLISGWGIRSDLETVLVYARAADTVARYEMDLPRGLDGTPVGDRGPSPDRLATFVARGGVRRLTPPVRLLAVAQGSWAITRGAGPAGPRVADSEGGSEPDGERG